MKRSNKVTILGAVFVMNVTVLFLLLMQLFLKKMIRFKPTFVCCRSVFEKTRSTQCDNRADLIQQSEKDKGETFASRAEFFGTEPPLPLHQFQLSDTFFLVRFRWIEVLGRTMKES